MSLVLVAALMHAGWNALAKRRADILVFFWLLTVASLAIYAIPLAILIVKHPPPRSGVPFLVASSLTHVVYYSSLARSYARSDLSLVYPVARGTGVLLVPLLALPIFGDRPTVIAWCGIGLIVFGVLRLHWPRIREALAHRQGEAVIPVWPLVTGLTIATYSLIDSAGVRRIHPFVYLYFTFVIIASLMAPYAWRRSAVVRSELRSWRPIVLGGAAIFGTYWIVLTAYRLAPVSYVVPMREISIVFGALLGVRFLGEPFGRSRIAACAVVACGVIAIAIGG